MAVGVAVVVCYRTFSVHHGAHPVVGGVGIRYCIVVAAAEGYGWRRRRHCIHLTRHGTTTVLWCREGREGDMQSLCCLAVVATVVGNPVGPQNGLVAGAIHISVAARHRQMCVVRAVVADGQAVCAQVLQRVVCHRSAVAVTSHHSRVSQRAGNVRHFIVSDSYGLN